MTQPTMWPDAKLSDTELARESESWQRNNPPLLLLFKLTMHKVRWTKLSQPPPPFINR